MLCNKFYGFTPQYKLITHN